MQLSPLNSPKPNLRSPEEIANAHAAVAQMRAARVYARQQRQYDETEGCLEALCRLAEATQTTDPAISNAAITAYQTLRDAQRGGPPSVQPDYMAVTREVCGRW
jgi:hypothetical protein